MLSFEIDRSEIMNLNLPLARKDDLVVQNLTDETLVYDCKIHKAFCLNKTSASVWNYCDGKNNAAQIAALMGKEFNSAVSEELVWLSISQLGEENLLAAQPEIPAAFNKINRREVIRRTAIAAAIALPVISAITAPPAASAASNAVACDTGQALITPVGSKCPAGCTNQETCGSGAGNCDGTGTCV